MQAEKVDRNNTKQYVFEIEKELNDELQEIGNEFTRLYHQVDNANLDELNKIAEKNFELMEKERIIRREIHELLTDNKFHESSLRALGLQRLHFYQGINKEEETEKINLTVNTIPTPGFSNTKNKEENFTEKTLASMKKSQLQKLCKSKNIDFREKDSKKALIDKLINA